MRLRLVFLLCFVTLVCVAQNKVHLKTGSISMFATVEGNRSPDLKAFGNRKYAFVRFASPLKLDQQEKLANQGVHLLSSVDGAYYMSFPENLELAGFAERPEVAGGFTPMLKLSERLLEKTSSHETIRIRLLHTGEHEYRLLESAIHDSGGNVTDLSFARYHILTVDIDSDKVINLAENPAIIWIEQVPESEEALRYQAVRNERVNILHSNKYGLTGKGITVGVGDAGKVGDHIDLNGHLTNYASNNVSAHATHVSGIIAGKPNLDPTKGTGVAPGATLVTSYFSNIIADAERHMRDHDMSITNNSYGTALSDCDKFGDYDLSAVFIDAQLAEHDTLTHVFAAGNSGGKTCSPFAQRYATVLTGWQSAKNTISVGMTTNKDVLAGGSSRGPVDDGRLKPEIVAVGKGVISTRPGNVYNGGGGTSYSSPAIAGISALLHEQYVALYGTKPKSTLIKALMLNTADDLGRPGPDYFFGYGRVNARRAVESLTAGMYVQGSVAQGDSVSMAIDVPPGAAELRLMLLWRDPAGFPFASPALTNDLDMTLSAPSSQIYMPWILDPTPSGVSNNAIRGRDTINNHEQVTINSPEAGSHNITIRGSTIPFGSQDYVIVYEVVMPEITVIHPNGFEPLRPTSDDVIRWDAYGDAVGPFHVEFSADGNVWETINAAVGSTTRYVNWTVPDSFSENVIVRVTSGLYADSSDNDMLIMDAPGSLTVSSPCASYAEISWSAVVGSDHYRIYQYIDDDMQVIDTTSATSYIVSGLEAGKTVWFSVAAVTSTLSIGPRAVAKSTLSALNENCWWAKDLRLASAPNLNNGRENTSTALSSLHNLMVRIVNSGTDTASGFEIGYKLNNGPPVIEIYSGDLPPGMDTMFTFSATEDLSMVGSYNYSIWCNLSGDTFPKNDSLDISIDQVANPAVSLPWKEDFEVSNEVVINMDKFAFAGLDAWDYNLISGQGRLRTNAGSGFILEGQRSITLDQTLYNSTAIQDIIGTINLSVYDTATHDIRLKFDFMHHEQAPDDNVNDMIWIRGSDTSSWIPLLDLYSVHALAGEKSQVISSTGITEMLSAYSQNFSSSFQIRFEQEGDASADSPTAQDGYTFDNIELFEVTNDIKLLSFNGPAEAGCGLGMENVSVRIVNTSSSTFEELIVSYSINANLPQSDTIEIVFPKMDSVFTFGTTLDFSAYGSYIIDVWIHHPLDTFRTNDSILGNAIFSYPNISDFPYFEDFETGNGGWISSGAFNSFALGKPQSTIIYKAASGDNAWVTNLKGDNNVNEISFLTSPCYDLSGLTQPVFSFALVQELENNYIFLWVEYTDSAGIWSKLGSGGAGTNWYNNNTEQAWDNVNKRWRVASIDIPVNLSQIQFRFAFIAEHGLQLEGVGIDAIHIHEKESVYFGGSTSPIAQPVSGPDWVHFDAPGGRLLSVHPKGQDLGLVNLDMFFHTGNVRNDDASYIYFRNWVIDAASVPGSAVKIRFYISEYDFLQMAAASGCGSCIVPVDGFESELFKFSGTIEDSILTNNNPGVYQYYDAYDLVVMPYDNGYAIEIEVTDFSEFWLTGSRTLAADSVYQYLREKSDDAEEFLASGGVNPFSDTLDFNPTYTTGLRYPDVRIRQGAFVRDARLIFTSESSQGNSGDIVIRGEGNDNSNSFTTGNYNISLRPQTELIFTWDPPSWQSEDSIRTPSIRAIVQEIIDKPGWQPGNALGFSLLSDSGVQAYSYDADPLKAAKLYIVFDSVCALEQRLYVDHNANGENTGDSWTDAISDLQHAINLASKCDGISEIWVSEGIYYPALEGQGRTFELHNGVQLYGGFTGVETILDQRDHVTNTTVLSGDLGLKGDAGDDAFHVVTVQGDADTARVDGFIIRNGNAMGTLADDQTGAGIKSAGNIILENCTIEDCNAQLDGSGIYHSGNNMTLILSNCILQNNSGTVIKNTGAGTILISDDNNIQNNE